MVVINPAHSFGRRNGLQNGAQVNLSIGAWGGAQYQDCVSQTLRRRAVLTPSKPFSAEERILCSQFARVGRNVCQEGLESE